ncbi:ComF family protein [Desulfovibrio sulfodismutans]|uniref:ComF family protein n=1 Tax=Desulfolutivibrio sulfodismutans TaxID=63561 RepID=A0A7K3NKJ8_9BACT|nr:ComF family protein [Desulfolutivibrio sulfodismutans]NDY56726.1 ComF family protein [Desulfolutivibrio sulfodismutans]QLA13997.1 ComF family protein [Desulfolutivibrio sulfodismutans DSM 3696]
MAFVRRLLAAVSWRDLLSRRCRVCGDPVPPGPDGRASATADWPPRGLCPACAKSLSPRRGGFCPRCGAMEADPADDPDLCAACLLEPRPFSALAFHAPYGGLLRDMILAFKFGERPQYGAVLRDLFLLAFERAAARGVREGGTAPATPHAPVAPIAPIAPDVVIPVPLYPRRLAWRGFNQSLELARPLARKYGWPVDAQALSRIRDTRPQSTLSGRLRRENIRGAFAADPARVRGKTALLTDDVMTTGATVEAAARALLAAGASRVDVLVLAR